MADSIRDMKLLGGHPALDFVNTVDSRGERPGPDLLRTQADLLLLAVRTGVITVQTADAIRLHADEADAVARVVALREGLYRACLAEAHGLRAEAADLVLVGEAAGRALARRHLVAGPEGPAWNSAIANFGGLLDALALEGAHLLTERDGRRPVRECEGRNCGWLFLDRSRGGRRRWCSDENCGTPSRVRRFRASAAE